MKQTIISAILIVCLAKGAAAQHIKSNVRTGIDSIVYLDLDSTRLEKKTFSDKLNNGKYHVIIKTKSEVTSMQLAPTKGNVKNYYQNTSPRLGNRKD